jgi:MFS family permease
LFLIVSRLLSATAYHVYQTILAPSLRERFRFTPAEYGSFFAFVGLFFALSQGVLARLCLRHLNGGGERSDLSTARQHRRRSRLLVACSAAVAAGRYAGYRSRTVAGLRAAFAVMASAYGVLSAVVAADAAQVAGPGEAGSFFGLLASVESGAGMAGPLLGGALASFSRRGGGGGGDGFDAALWAVLVLNGLGTLLIALGYERIVLRNLRPADGEQLSRHAKQH